MQNSQLLFLIKSLTKHEMRDLRKVVRSPYFNQREDVIHLFDFIENSLNSKNPNFLKEKAFNRLFQNKTYDDILMRQIMSYLYKTIQKYLITEGVLQNEMDSQLYLIEKLRLRNAHKILEKQLDETIKIMDRSIFRNADFHYSKYVFLIEEFEYYSKKRESETKLQELTNELDFFYMSEYLRQGCAIITRQKVEKKNYQQPLLRYILDFIDNNYQSLPPSVLSYYYAYKALTEQESDTFYKLLKTLIVNQGYLFPENERRDLYFFAINYCIGRLNRGDKIYGKQALELYRACLDNNVLLENGVLPPYTYKNMLMLALKAEEYDWAERVLYDFKQYLPEKERENIFNYNLAIFYFRTGKYPEAMMLLQKVNLNDVLYNLDARRLLARIYYETDENNALHSLIESSKVYLHRQKDIGYHHDMYANYFRFLERMMKIDLKKADSRGILRGEVEGTQLLAEREWFMQKLK